MPRGRKKQTNKQKKKKKMCNSADFYRTVQNHISHTPNMGFRAKVFNELERFQVFMDY